MLKFYQETSCAATTASDPNRKLSCGPLCFTATQLDVGSFVKLPLELSHHSFLFLWRCASHFVCSGKVSFIAFLHSLHDVHVAFLPDLFKRPPGKLRITWPTKIPTCQSFHKEPHFADNRRRERIVSTSFCKSLFICQGALLEASILLRYVSPIGTRSGTGSCR